ncbi:DUF6385 domain-containing protein [Microbacterium sp.]|uniref:DUF6385 domain-containing protein n=1 Tax=Microbacterium sp. TaxID=51671 RepID=UPI003F9AE36B
MQQTNTSVLVRRAIIDCDFATLPYEIGWAREAVVFVQTEGAHPPLTLATEISPDGISWIRRGREVTLAAQESLADLPLTTFGNWLRLVVSGASLDATARILVHVNGKG